jgi:hypothetical protein
MVLLARKSCLFWIHPFGFLRGEDIKQRILLLDCLIGWRFSFFWIIYVYVAPLAQPSGFQIVFLRSVKFVPDSYTDVSALSVMEYA